MKQKLMQPSVEKNDEILSKKTQIFGIKSNNEFITGNINPKTAIDFHQYSMLIIIFLNKLVVFDRSIL